MTANHHGFPLQQNMRCNTATQNVTEWTNLPVHSFRTRHIYNCRLTDTSISSVLHLHTICQVKLVNTMKMKLCLCLQAATLSQRSGLSLTEPTNVLQGPRHTHIIGWTCNCRPTRSTDSWHLSDVWLGLSTDISAADEITTDNVG